MEILQMFLLEMQDHSIALCWVIMCHDWVGDGAFGCPNLEAASGARTHSLRKPGGRTLRTSHNKNL